MRLSEVMARSGQGVLEPHPGQVLVEVDAHHLLEEGGKVGAVVLGVVRQVFQGQLFGIMV